MTSDVCSAMSSMSAVVGVLADIALQTSASADFVSTVCIVCGQQLSEVRLSAQPEATMCVPCLEEQGDVTPITDQTIRTTQMHLDDESAYSDSVARDRLRNIYSGIPATELDEDKFPSRFA